MSQTVTQWIEAAPEPQRAQLETLRGLVLAACPGAEESIKWSRPCYARPGVTSLFCYLHRAKAHVTLGFQKGALLDDPHDLLTGEGQEMRHIKFGPNDTIDAAACRALLLQALTLDAG